MPQDTYLGQSSSYPTSYDQQQQTQSWPTSYPVSGGSTPTPNASTYQFQAAFSQQQPQQQHQQQQHPRQPPLGGGGGIVKWEGDV